MSETMLEKAARAVWNPKALGLRDDEIETVWRNQSEEDRRVYFGIARAVLMAVREPDTGVGLMGAEEVNRNMRGVVKADYCAAKDSFTAMIDAILAQEPGA